MIYCIKPSLKSTHHNDDFHIWMPNTLENLLAEIDHIISSCEEADPAPFFRGQADCKWPLDSTFVRSAIERLLGLSDYQELKTTIRQSVSFHRAITFLVLFKFGTLWEPSKKLFELEKTKDIDAWYEYLKNIQQHPEKYPEFDDFIRGTFLLDWSLKKEIGLYFSIYDGKGDQRRILQGHGALWICDAMATGNTLTGKKLGEILNIMREGELVECEVARTPVVVHPPKQLPQPRAVSQRAVYVFQRDFRYDVADVWVIVERQRKKRIFVKLIIREDIKDALAQYLESKGVSEDNVYAEQMAAFKSTAQPVAGVPCKLSSAGRSSMKNTTTKYDHAR